MIRQAAIKSMTGTSGRQRVESGVFDKLIINLPEIVEQRAIAKVLSDLDEKIELNNQMNKTLEAMGQALFKRWFVDFEFPGHEKTKLVKGIPDGWHQGALGEICTIESGKRPEAKSDSRTEECAVPLIGASSVMGYVKTLLYNEPILIIGRVGTHGVVQRVLPPSFPSDNTLVIRPKYYEYIYQVLKTIDYDSLNVGTTQPLITQTAVKKHDTLIPSDNILEKFETAISPLFIKVAANNQESDVLAGIRDSLLPKLMSGKIRMVQ
jgi:type I restriction enzyme S subunit